MKTMHGASRKNAHMTRREVIRHVSALMGGVALVGHSALLRAAGRSLESGQSEGVGRFTGEQVTLLDEVAETILPETETPGAKAAGVGPFIALMVTDCYAPSERQVFREGLHTLRSRCRALSGADFVEAPADARLELIRDFDREQWEYMNRRAEGEPVHWFRMMKEQALLGYFTSEIGYTQVMRYAETPGRYEPCVPYRPGDKIWADHA